MTRNNWILVCLVAVLAGLVFFKPQFGWVLQSWFRPEILDDRGTVDLALENSALKAELAKLQNIKSQLPEKPWNYMRATVLSRYPLNFKNEFLVDAGLAQGVEKGKAVVFDGSVPSTSSQPSQGSGGQAGNKDLSRVLVGRIEKVFEGSSLVKTVFDSGFQTAVRVGSWASDALFKGGLEPKIVLLPLNAPIKTGDVVYSASPDFPYGLSIASIKEVATSSDKLFREAALEFAYDINEIKSVLISL